jgi:hypothetical protein
MVFLLDLVTAAWFHRGEKLIVGSDHAFGKTSPGIRFLDWEVNMALNLFHKVPVLSQEVPYFLFERMLRSLGKYD